MLLLALGSAVGWTLFDFSRRQVGKTFPAIPAVVAIMATQALLCLPLGGFDAIPNQDSTWFVAAGLSILANSLANVLFILAVQRAAFTLVIPLLSLSPAFAAAAGWISFDEALNLKQMAAVAIIVAAALWLGWQGEGRKPEPKERSAIFMMSLTAVLWAIVPFFDRACTQSGQVSLSAYVGAQCVGVALCLGFVALIRRDLRAQFQGFGSQLRVIWPWVLVAAFAASFGLYFQIKGVISVTHVGLFEAVKRSLTMLLSLSIGRFILKETVSVQKVIAATIMVLGIFLLA